MIEQNSPLSNIHANLRAERKDKDTSVVRIPRDPENPQKFQTMVVREKEKKDNREPIKEEEQETALSIFDISSQKTKKTRSLDVARPHTGKEAEAMRAALPLAKDQDTEEKVDADSEEDSAVSEDDSEVAGSSKKEKSDDVSGSKLVKDTSSEHQKDSEGSSHSNSSGDHSDRHEESAAHAEIPAQLIATAAPPIAPSQTFVPSQVPPPVPVLESVAPSSSTSTPASSGRDLQLIIDKVVETMTLLQSNNQTDLAVTLRYPPILEGAQLVVSSFGSATGEFNIAFYNLTQSSQQFLEQMQARAGIKQALEEKGYIMHMFITTAQPYAPIVATDAENKADQRHFRDEDGQKGNNKKNRQDA